MPMCSAVPNGSEEDGERGSWRVAAALGALRREVSLWLSGWWEAGVWRECLDERSKIVALCFCCVCEVGMAGTPVSRSSDRSERHWSTAVEARPRSEQAHPETPPLTTFNLLLCL